MSYKYNPLISIIIPIYNGSKFLEESIDSALNQTYKNIEIIVINDGSTDETEKIVKAYGDKVSYYKKENGGVSTALNLGIGKARGEYISWLSHDDVYEPEKIETQIKGLSELPESIRGKTIVYSNFRYIDEVSKQTGIAPIHRYHQKKKLQLPLYPIVKGLINGCTLLIPKRCFNETGLFDPSLRYTQDYDLWLKMFPQYSLLYQKNYLVRTRQHSGQGTHTTQAKAETNAFWIKLIDNISDEDKMLLDGSVGQFHYQLIKQMRHFGNQEAATYAQKRYDELKEPPQIQLLRRVNNTTQPLTSIIYYLHNSLNI